MNHNKIMHNKNITITLMQQQESYITINKLFFEKNKDYKIIVDIIKNDQQCIHFWSNDHTLYDTNNKKYLTNGINKINIQIKEDNTIDIGFIAITTKALDKFIIKNISLQPCDIVIDNTNKKPISQVQLISIKQNIIQQIDPTPIVNPTPIIMNNKAKIIVECQSVNYHNNTPKILIVLDKYQSEYGFIERHTDILVKEFNCAVHELNKNSNVCYDTFDVIIWQSTNHKIVNKCLYQKFIYIVHQVCDWNETDKKIMIENNEFINEYVFISANVKNAFEQKLFILDNGYVIENNANMNNLELTNSDPNLCVSFGTYMQSENQFGLIKLFEKLNQFQLEIYGDVIDHVYYRQLQLYIMSNKLTNVKLFATNQKYFGRLVNANYYCTLTTNQLCNYFMLDAISLGKKIICSPQSINSDTVKYYPNKYIYENNSPINKLIYWLHQSKHVPYLPYTFNHFIEPYKNIIYNQPVKIKQGYTTVTSIADVLSDIATTKNATKNGYSILLRIKNEQESIEKCILDIVDLVDEIIVVDNNSTDNTLEIIRWLERLYSNVFVYEYQINVPRYGQEHINNFKKLTDEKNNTLATYYNWTASKATFNKKIKWDGDFWCIRSNFKKLLDEFRNETNILAVHFSGITLFIDKDDYYIKNKSYYNEYRLFLNNDQLIWSDYLISENNYCETSCHFSNNTNNKFIYRLFIFIETKITTKNEFLSKSELVNDGRDNIDYQIMNKLQENAQLSHELLIKTTNLYYDIDDMVLQTGFFDIDCNIKSDNHCLIEQHYYQKPYYDAYFMGHFLFKKKKRILLVIDSYGWAFDNISKKILTYCKNVDIHIVPYPSLGEKINDETTRESIEEYDIIIMFWYGAENHKILDFYRKKVPKIYLCLYDYSQWVNNVNKTQENVYRSKLAYFIDKIDGYLFSTPFIPINFENCFASTKFLPKFPCYDGVDIDKFYYQGYTNEIYTKPLLTVGWIGNSNPHAHGINKGFILIKNVVEKMNDKFMFQPQDSMIKRISHDEVPAYIGQVDIIVCFSMAEGTPNQILEASASGKCWISTKVGISVELYNTIENNPTGILINRDEYELANALQNLYNNREIIVQFGKNGRAAIEKTWSWSEKVKQFYDVFITD